MNLTAGTALQNGTYVLNSPLGQSALGLSFKATQARSHQTVVLKTLRVQPQTDSAHLKRQFVEEARRLAQCQHPGLVRVLDIFEDAGLPFVVMDYVMGQPLSERVRSRGALPEADAVQYIRQAGSALGVMHRQGLLHRDLKPENLVRPKGASFVVLVDPSIAHYAVLSMPDTSEAAASPYEALELHQRQVNLTAATDLYALAATLYFLVTGQEPIAAPRRTQSPVLSPRQLQPQLSIEIEQAILSGMALNPQERPQTIAAWFAQLPNRQPNSNMPAEQGLAHGVGQPRAAIDLPNPTASSFNGASLPTAPPAPLATVAPTTHTAPSIRQSTPGPATVKSRLPKALLMTAAIAIAAGSGLGLALRFSAAHGIGPTFFQTQQDFPPVQNWPLQASPAASTAPPSPEPPPIRSFVPERLPKVKFSPSPSPLTPSPSPTETIEASPTPAPSLTNPIVPSAPFPSPALPTEPMPHPIPSASTPAASPLR